MTIVIGLDIATNHSGIAVFNGDKLLKTVSLRCPNTISKLPLAKYNWTINAFGEFLDRLLETYDDEDFYFVIEEGYGGINAKTTLSLAVYRGIYIGVIFTNVPNKRINGLCIENATKIRKEVCGSGARKKEAIHEFVSLKIARDDDFASSICLCPDARHYDDIIDAVACGMFGVINIKRRLTPL